MYVHSRPCPKTPVESRLDGEQQEAQISLLIECSDNHNQLLREDDNEHAAAFSVVDPWVFCDNISLHIAGIVKVHFFMQAKGRTGWNSCAQTSHDI